MPFKVLAFALPLLALPASSFAQDQEKKGLPCVSEICLGDGIAELSKIQWVPAQSPYKINNKIQLMGSRKLSDDDLRTLKGTFAEPGDAAPYLQGRQFDNAALPALALVPAACDSNELFGNYGADGETPTRVGISLAPSAGDPAKQVWKVTTIVREFPSAVTNADKAVLTKLLEERYGKFGAGQRAGSPKPGEGRFFPGGMSRFGFGLSMLRDPEEAKVLSKHPSCRPAKEG